VRRVAVLFALVFVFVVALAPTTASARPPMPCDYWVHGCDVTAYLCDAGVCLN
jgi:hypothetical protein